MVRVAPSILDVTGDVNAYLRRVSNADAVHIDVIDGKFVRGKKPGRNLWIKDVKKIRTTLHKHVHLMIRNPEKYVTAFIAAGAGTISFHIEATKHPQKVIDLIRKKRKKVCIAMDPETPLSRIKPWLDQADQILVMTIHPGRGGQKFMKSMLLKIKKLRRIYKGRIEVDGGINLQTGRLAVRAGATDLVVGHYILTQKNPRKAVQKLKRL